MICEIFWKTASAQNHFMMVDSMLRPSTWKIGGDWSPSLIVDRMHQNIECGPCTLRRGQPHSKYWLRHAVYIYIYIYTQILVLELGRSWMTWNKGTCNCQRSRWNAEQTDIQLFVFIASTKSKTLAVTVYHNTALRRPFAVPVMNSLSRMSS